jgi:hypothetical protein
VQNDPAPVEHGDEAVAGFAREPRAQRAENRLDVGNRPRGPAIIEQRGRVRLHRRAAEKNDEPRDARLVEEPMDGR